MRLRYWALVSSGPGGLCVQLIQFAVKPVEFIGLKPNIKYKMQRSAGRSADPNTTAFLRSQNWRHCGLNLGWLEALWFEPRTVFPLFLCASSWAFEQGEENRKQADASLLMTVCSCSSLAGGLRCFTVLNVDILLASCAQEVSPQCSSSGSWCLHARSAHHFHLSCRWHPPASFHWDCLFPSCQSWKSPHPPLPSPAPGIVPTHPSLQPSELGMPGHCLGFLYTHRYFTRTLLSSSPFPSSKFKGSFTYVVEKSMATHSSILAWRTPWTEESGW